MTYRGFFSHVVDVVEGVGAAILVLGGLGAFIRFAYDLLVHHGMDAYEALRRNLGRVILLGLEVLIIADIIRTIVVDQSVESVTVLGVIVLIRVVLSFSLEAEIDGMWPWNRWRAEPAAEESSSAPDGSARMELRGREAAVASLDDFERYPLTFGPSPIHPLRRLSAHLGGAVEIWAKREDCSSGIAFGGNKTRKLEYLIPDALAQGCDTLVSIGGVQSNHTRQVTGVAAHVGLKAVTVQEAWVDWPDVVYDKVGNIQLSRIMGGDVRMDPAGFDIGIRDSWQRALDSVVEAGGTPYPIPAGASDHPLGGLGFANWAREVAAQEVEHDIFFDHVIVCTVTGSTHAGMIAGFALEDRSDRHVVGIDASATLEKTLEQVSRIARATAAKIGLDRDLRSDEITIVDGYSAGIYGIPDAQTIDAIRTCARLEGMLTDPVYEGKSMAGMIGMIRSGEIPPGSRVLYAHLGGQPCLSAYAGAL